MYFSHCVLSPLTLSVNSCKTSFASVGTARISRVGGKKIGLYRSMALLMISHEAKLLFTVNAFGRMKSKSVEMLICCGCGQTALIAACFP